MVKALFLDRDGTVNVDKGYVGKIEDFCFIDGIMDLCRIAQEKGYKIIICTNQSGIARGYYTIEDYNALTEHMLALFRQQGIEIADVFFCPTLDGFDRKPNPGLFIKAQVKHGIDMAASVSVGDKKRDIIAAQSAGVGRNYLLSETTYFEIGEKL